MLGRNMFVSESEPFQNQILMVQIQVQTYFCNRDIRQEARDVCLSFQLLVCVVLSSSWSSWGHRYEWLEGMDDSMCIDRIKLRVHVIDLIIVNVSEWKSPDSAGWKHLNRCQRPTLALGGSEPAAAVNQLLLTRRLSVWPVIITE